MNLERYWWQECLEKKTSFKARNPFGIGIKILIKPDAQRWKNNFTVEF
jgi:hypothetical protein